MQCTEDEIPSKSPLIVFIIFLVYATIGFYFSIKIQIWGAATQCLNYKQSCRFIYFVSWNYLDINVFTFPNCIYKVILKFVQLDPKRQLMYESHSQCADPTPSSTRGKAASNHLNEERGHGKNTERV